MSHQVIYPHQSAVLHGDVQPESPISKNDSHGGISDQTQYSGVAQLPVMTEMHQPPQTGFFPRSVSMPLPANNNNGTSNLESSSPSSQQLLPSLASQNEIKSTTIAKIEHLKNWSISTYKCTKQFISEKLGKSTRTVDTELESQIELLRDVQRKYLNILRLSRALSSHFQHVVITQVKKTNY